MAGGLFYRKKLMYRKSWRRVPDPTIGVPFYAEVSGRQFPEATKYYNEATSKEKLMTECELILLRILSRRKWCKHRGSVDYYEFLRLRELNKLADAIRY